VVVVGMDARIIALGQLDAVAFDAVHRTDMDAVGTDHFHAFLDLAHRRFSSFEDTVWSSPGRQRLRTSRT